MPWHREAKKDVATDEMPRRAGSKLWPEDVRMGKPNRGHALLPEREQTKGSETSQYLEEKKTIVIPWVVASEKGRAQTVSVKAEAGL